MSLSHIFSSVYGILFPVFVAVVATTSFFPVAIAAPASAEQRAKPRVIVTTDGETDDRCSMNRFLLYTNEVEVLGLIHSSSKHHWKGDSEHAPKKWEPVVWLDEMLNNYAAVYPNLRLHEDDYPTPDYLREQVFVGNIAYEGEMTLETPGSNRIVEVLLDENPAPVWLQAWGGPNTIARALKTIEEKHPEKMAAVAKKAHIFLISEQDTTYKSYIRGAWPTIQVIRSGYESYGIIAYRWDQQQSAEVQPYFETEWMGTHITSGHGPLCAAYETKKGRFRSEGDSPAFLHVLHTGLRSVEDPRYGGWGGRFAFSNGMWRSVDEMDSKPHSIGRWAIEFQHDWAARADWCVAPVEEANHHPVIALSGPLDRTVKAGESISLDAQGTTDPDGDTLTFQWWHYAEASTYTQPVSLNTPTSATTTITIPQDAVPGDTIHIVCTVRDDGTPPLARHARHLFTVSK